MERLNLDKKLKSHHTFVLGVCASLVCAFSFAVFAQSNPPDASRLLMPSTAWVSMKWTGDNRKYHDVRIQIDQLAIQGKLTPEALRTYYGSFLQNPRDPLVLFRWAYADNLAIRLKPDLPQHVSPGDGAFEACPNPRTYDYDRTRLLLNWPGNESLLLPLAKRLLAHDPKDYPLQYNLATLSSGTDAPTEKAAAVRRAERLLSQYPNKPEIYGLLGGIYCDHWVFKKDPADGRKAIFYYQKYLQIANPNDPWRKQAKFWIERIESASK